MRRLSLVLLSALVVFAAGASVAWAIGELTQKPSVEGCVSENGTSGACEDGNGIGSVNGVVVSPDGKNVYTAGFTTDSLAVFVRDPATGGIDQTACFTNAPTAGCTDVAGLDQASDVVVSPDGKHVYMASPASSAIAIFARSTSDGSLTAAGCVSNAGGECTDSTVPIGGAQVLAISADGKQLYVASEDSDAVATFSRNATTGALTDAGCISDSGSIPCANGRTLNFAPDGALDMEVTPDGKHVVVIAIDAFGVAILDRDATTGALTQDAGTTGCVTNGGSGGTCANAPLLDDPARITVSPDSEHVYVAASGNHTIVVLDRDTTTGGLAQTSCVEWTGENGTCPEVPGLLAIGQVKVSPDGDSVYAAGIFSDTVTILDRNETTGALTVKPGQEGCIAQTNAGDTCKDGRAMSQPFSLAVSPDNASVYVGTLSAASVVVLDRAGGTLQPPTKTETQTQTQTQTTPADAGGGTTTAATTPPPPVTTLPRPPVVSPPPTTTTPTASAFVSLPSARKCVSRRRLRVTLKVPPGQHVRGARVLVNGKRKATRTSSRFTAPVNLTGLPKGRFTVVVEVTLADGRKLTQRRRFRTCAAKRKRG